MRKVKYIENISEITAGTRGASLGVDAMRVAAYKRQSNFFTDNDFVKIKDENDQLLNPLKFTNAKRIEGLNKVFDYVGDEVKSTLLNGSFPFVLAADHGSAGGTIAGIKAAFPDKRLGVVWIDAHADLHSPYTTPSGNMHGMPLATAIADDNLESKVNHLSDTEKGLWEDLKGKYGITPKIKSEDLFFIGVRDTEKPEDDLMARRSIKNYLVEEVREKGCEAVVSDILEKLKECDIIYVSFDVDSMDSEISVGTGTPVPNGLSASEASRILNLFAQSPKLVCMEMVEINPCLDDKGNVMAETSLDILEKVSEEIKRN